MVFYNNYMEQSILHSQTGKERHLVHFILMCARWVLSAYRQVLSPSPTKSSLRRLVGNLIRQGSPPEAGQQSECSEFPTWEFLFISKLYAMPVACFGESPGWPPVRTEGPQVLCCLCTRRVNICPRTSSHFGNLQKTCPTFSKSGYALQCNPEVSTVLNERHCIRKPL